MNILEFMLKSPSLSFLFAILLLLGLYQIFNFLRFCINRPLRHLNIWKHGWPPPHCDGDGDFKPVEEVKEER